MAKRDSGRAEKETALFVPGGVTSAELAYGAVIRGLDGRVNALSKDLEVYAGDRPPADFGLGTEVEGILRTVEKAGVERFHLVGFSGGGAVSLASAAKYPQRLRSLALIEPAWIGNDGWTAEDKADFAELDRIMALPEAERMAPFRRGICVRGSSRRRCRRLPGRSRSGWRKDPPDSTLSTVRSKPTTWTGLAFANFTGRSTTPAAA